MIYTKSLNQINNTDFLQTGGKAASLGELLRIGITVPEGFVITTDCYKNFWNQEIPVDVKEEILKIFANLKSARVAVRSSAVAEDSSNASWAGQLDTFLNVNRENLIDAIRKCWQSIHTEKALSYAGQRDLDEADLAIAVIVQKMVESDVSGVMFTVNPVNKGQNELMIEAGFGLGELLVQGEITPDNYIVDKKTGEIKSRTIGSQQEMLVYKYGKNTKVSIQESMKGQQILDQTLIKELTELGKRIEQHYNSPQDIEWAIEKGKIYILQSRPITTI